MKRIILSIVVSLSATFSLSAQVRIAGPEPEFRDPHQRGGDILIVDTNYTVEELITDFFYGSCVTPFNIQHIGNTAGLGYFQGYGTILDLPAGLILSSGNVYNTYGPNNNCCAGNSLGQFGDPDLNLLSAQTTYDASGVEFDFIPEETFVYFRYVFSSEEYPEYTCASFNDVFAFFISGPGLNGPFINEAINIANIPGTSLPVGINTVNPGVPGQFGGSNCGPNGSLAHSNLYVDNTGDTEIQFDGLTVPINTTVLQLIPGEVYHAKVVVADAGDSIFDSAVFISIESLCGDSLLIPQASLSVSYPAPDKVLVTPKAKYSYDAWLIDFGDGTQIETKVPYTHTYAVPGVYPITFTAENYCCVDTVVYNAHINQPPFVRFENIIQPGCNNASKGSISLEIESSVGGLTYEWNDGGGNDPVRTNLEVGVYEVTITDAHGQETIAGPYVIEDRTFQAELIISPPKSSITNVKVAINQGKAPYLYRWSDGKNNAMRTDLKAGVHYKVTVTDANQCEKVLNVQLPVSPFEPNGPVFTIMPNPISGSNFTVSLPEVDISKGFRISVTNTLGQEVFYKVWETPSQTIPMDASTWSNGIYLITCQWKDGVISSLLSVSR